MRAAGFGPYPKRLAIMRERSLSLPLGHPQISQKLVGVRKLGIGPQGRLQLELRFVELARPPESHRIVVSRGGVVWPQPKRNVEVIARPAEIAGCGKKISQVAVGVSVIRLYPYGLSKRGLRPCPLPSREPD